jgi:hypothetical protein
MLINAFGDRVIDENLAEGSFLGVYSYSKVKPAIMYACMLRLPTTDREYKVASRTRVYNQIGRIITIVSLLIRIVSVRPHWCRLPNANRPIRIFISNANRRK